MACGVLGTVRDHEAYSRYSETSMVFLEPGNMTSALQELESGKLDVEMLL